MLISTVGPQETIRWFEEYDQQHEILCCIITANSRHRTILKELAQNYLDADAALGSRVGLVLFGGTDPDRFIRLKDGDFGKRLYIPGEFLTPTREHKSEPTIVAMRDWERRNEFWDGSREKADKFSDAVHRDQIGYAAEGLSVATARIASEWMELLDLKYEQLPALCILVKGRDAAVVQLGQDVDTAAMMRLLGQLGDIARREAQEERRIPLDAVERVGRARARMHKIQEVEAKLESSLNALCNRFNASENDRLVATNFLMRRDYSEDAVERMFAMLSFFGNADFTTVADYRKFQSHTESVRKSIQNFESDLPLPQDLKTLGEEREAAEKRRDETARLVVTLQSQGLHAQSIPKGALGATFDRWGKRVAQLETLIEGGRKIFEWMKGMPKVPH
jgi:hypothetical protein